MAANFKNISNGVGLVPNAGSVVTIPGDVAYNSVSSSLEVFTVSAESVTTASNVQSFSNKTINVGGSNLIGTTSITGATGTGNVTFSIAPIMQGVNIAGGATTPGPCIVINDTTNVLPYFTVLGNGFVGIGETNPSTPFSVTNNVNGFVTTIQNTNTTTGQSNGVRISAGKNSTDTLLQLRLATDASILFSVSGDGSVVSTGTASFTNLSGSNTGDVSLTSVGSAPSANGASLSGQALTLQPADNTHPGLVTAGTQTIGGDKTFTGNISFTGGSVINPLYPTSTFTSSGTVDGLDVTNKTYIEVSGGITQIEGFANGKPGQLVIINVAQSSLTIIQNNSNFQPIICPNNANFVVSPEGSVSFVFNGTVWKVVSKAI